MRPIRLETASGAHVCSATMPPFDPLPEVLLWGQRFFILLGIEIAGPAVYREAFCWALPSTDVLPDPGPARQLNTDNPRTAP